jgi:hypothetical protein
MVSEVHRRAFWCVEIQQVCYLSEFREISTQSSVEMSPRNRHRFGELSANIHRLNDIDRELTTRPNAD